MAPILEELATEYAGKLVIEFIDVEADPKAGKPYGIRVRPTQALIDSSGREVFRHEGFFPKEDIVAKLNEMGVTPGDPKAAASDPDLDDQGAQAPGNASSEGEN